MELLRERAKEYKIVLGSASPRRRQLLAGLDIEFTVENNIEVTEEYNIDGDPYQIPLMLSKRKSHAFARSLTDREILITADTLVFCNGTILGKPANKEEAVKMLTQLSGACHSVITGVTLRSLTKEVSFSSHTKVYFAPMSTKEIEYYIDTYHPFDKAGSYGAQDWIGYTAIEKIDGCYYNVVGMPVSMLSKNLLLFMQ